MISERKTLFTLPMGVLLGAILGVIFGITFGEYAKVFAPLGAAYTMLLQAVVYPYLICSLLSGIGKLSWESDSKLLTKGTVIYALLLLFMFLTLFLLSAGLPSLSEQSPSQPLAAPSLIDLIIPSNIFTALSSNYVPAVVIFVLFFGAVLQGVKNKLELINILDVINKTCLEFWNWLVKLAPFAVFFLLAETSGTMRLNQLLELNNYLALFYLGTMLITFWILPVTISSITKLPYLTVLRELKPALVLSAATTLSVVALPHIREVTLKFLAERKIESNNEKSIINTATSLSYPFGQLGNMFISLYMLFTSLYFNHSLTAYQQLVLPFISYISSLGSPSTVINSVAFLSRWLNLPEESIGLYFGIVPLVRYGQVLLSVMGIAFIVITTSFAFFNLIKVNIKRLLFHITCFFLIMTLIVGTAKYFTTNPNIKIYNRLNSTQLPIELTQAVKATIYTSSLPANYPKSGEDALSRIQKTGILRVGYNPDMRPFVFFNNHNELVGYDVELVYALAKSLKVQLAFIPFKWENLVNDIKQNHFDIAIGAIYVTPTRLQQVSFSSPYFQSPLSFIVPRAEKTKFLDVHQIAGIHGLKIGMFQDPVLIPMIKNNFPAAKIVLLENFQSKTIKDAFEKKLINVVMWSSAQTYAWALGHPNYTSVMPEKVVAPFLFGYMVNSKSTQFLGYLNYWLQLQKVEKTQNTLYKRWIEVGINLDETKRWSILEAIRSSHFARDIF